MLKSVTQNLQESLDIGGYARCASQFCQSFFAQHLVVGETAKIAFRHSRDAIPGRTRFRLWKKGQVTDGHN